MAISVNWATKTFSVPQADLALVTGTLYEMDTETYFRSAINAIMASEDGIVFPVSIDHNTEYTVAGVTYARKVEMVNGYSWEASPNSQWSVRLVGSNNNLFDIEAGVLNQNQVQVIPTNSAGLQTVVSGSGVTAQDKTDIITGVWAEVLEGAGMTAARMLRSVCAGVMAKLSGVPSAGQSGTITIRNITDTVDMAEVEVDGDGNRTGVTYDFSDP